MAAYKYGGEGVVTYGTNFYGNLVYADATVAATELGDQVVSSLLGAGYSADALESSDSALVSAEVSVGAVAALVDSADSAGSTYVVITYAQLSASESLDVCVSAASNLISANATLQDSDTCDGYSAVSLSADAICSESSDTALAATRIPWSKIGVPMTGWTPESVVPTTVWTLETVNG